MLNPMLAGLLVGAAVLSAHAQTSSDIRVVQLNYTLIFDKKDQAGQASREITRQVVYIADDGRERREDLDSQGQMKRIHIIDPRTRSVGVLYPGARTVQQVPAGSSLGDPSACCEVPESITPNSTAVVRARIAGLDCVVSTPKAMAIGSIEFTTCRNPVTRKPFLGRSVVRYSEGSTFEQTLESFRNDVVLSEALFRVPSDYRSGN